MIRYRHIAPLLLSLALLSMRAEAGQARPMPEQGQPIAISSASLHASLHQGELSYRIAGGQLLLSERVELVTITDITGRRLLERQHISEVPLPREHGLYIVRCLLRGTRIVIKIQL